MKKPLTDPCSNATIRPQHEEATGYIALTDGKSRQIICKRVGDVVILHWKRSGEAVPIPIEEWRQLFA